MIDVTKKVYLDAILDQTPRLLGFLDRNVNSETYGCFDRHYWHYKLIDFPCARYQEAVLTLALLYKYGPAPYRNSAQILEWINAGINFWCNIQQRNGSFSEWYPEESSFVASAFSTYAISETLLVMGKGLLDEPKILRHLQKAGDWLCDKQDFQASNQTSGAIAALYNIFLLTNIAKYRIAAEKKVNLMKDIQKEEGWFNEYGGADIGYLSLTIDYLAKYYLKSKDDIILSILKKSINFISEFIYPGFTSGGTYGSRNTEYLIPSGFEIISSKFERAAYCAMNIRRATLEHLASLDDRYLSYIGYNWLQAYIYAGEVNLSQKLEEKEAIFPEAGIYIRRAKDFLFVSNFKKGGAFSLFIHPHRKIFDSGVIIEDFGRNSFYSGYMGSSYLDTQQENELVIKGSLGIIKELMPNTFKFLLFRIFQMTLGRSERLSLLVKQRLRNRLIIKTSSSNIKFARMLRFKSGKVEITDKITGNINKIKRIILGTKSSYIFVPSSRYFQYGEIDSSPTVIESNEIPHYTKGDDFVFTRSFGTY